MSLDSRSQTVSDEFHTIQNVCWENGWTDGLPVVPPTESAVRKMLSSVPDDPSTVLGRMDPSNAQVTLEKLAINSVMAGCLPEYFPVVIASVKAILDKDFSELIQKMFELLFNHKLDYTNFFRLLANFPEQIGKSQFGLELHSWLDKYLKICKR